MYRTFLIEKIHFLNELKLVSLLRFSTIVENLFYCSIFLWWLPCFTWLFSDYSFNKTEKVSSLMYLENYLQQILILVFVSLAGRGSRCRSSSSPDRKIRRQLTELSLGKTKRRSLAQHLNSLWYFTFLWRC
jgi:hypothetical protein